jgi:hypothetical protein
MTMPESPALWVSAAAAASRAGDMPALYALTEEPTFTLLSLEEPRLPGLFLQMMKRAMTMHEINLHRAALSLRYPGLFK